MFFRNFLLSFIVAVSAICASAQDSLDVELVCPENVTINCESELSELSTYGKARYRVGEETNDMEDQRSKRNIDDCGKGNIERIWRYKSEEGEEFKCAQFIYIGEDEEGKALINWPVKEVVISWCDPSYSPNDLPEGARRPLYYEGECNKMEHTYSDEIIYITDSCKEVHRKWVVHDWCYDSKNIAGNDGHYKFTQVIKFDMPDDIDYLLLNDVIAEAADCEKAKIDLPDVKVGIKDCNRRVKIKNDSPFADSKKGNASGVYPVGETVVNFIVELECSKAKEFALRITVTSPCDEKAIIDQNELADKLKQSFVRPNPFTSNTEILLISDKPQTGTLSLYKTNGEIISQRPLKLTSGPQSLKISEKELALPGVYFYSILIGERKLEGRLIKIR